MAKLIAYEFYKLFHSRSIALLFIILILMSIPIFQVSLANRVLRNVYAVEMDKIGNDDDIKNAISDVQNMGYHAMAAFGYYWFDADSMKYFESGGSLYEKYKNNDFLNMLYPLQKVDYIMLETDEDNAYVKGIFFKALDDPSAIAYSSIIFAAFFFGIDFKKRTYNSMIYYGVSRNEIIFVKLIIYIVICILLSLMELIIAFAVFCPDVLSLPSSYTFRYLLFRTCMDVGALCYAIVFIFLIKKVYLAMGAYLIFIILFLSNKSIVYLSPYRWENLDIYRFGLDNNTIIKTIITTLLLVLINLILSIIIFSRSKLK